MRCGLGDKIAKALVKVDDGILCFLNPPPIQSTHPVVINDQIFRQSTARRCSVL